MLTAVAQSCARRSVFASSAHVYGTDRDNTPALSESDQLSPVTVDGLDKARVEEMLAACGAEWVAIRSAAFLSIFASARAFVSDNRSVSRTSAECSPELAASKGGMNPECIGLWPWGGCSHHSTPKGRGSGN